MKETKLDYYANKDYISNSNLGLLKRSPAYFKANIDGDLERKESLSLERGSLLHMAILEPEKFVVADVEPITGKIGKFIEAKATGCTNEEAYAIAEFKNSMETVLKGFNTQDGQAYYQFLKNSQGKIALSKQDKYVIDKCIESLRNNEFASELLFTEDKEKEYYNEHEIYIDEFKPFSAEFKAKAKIDRLIIDRKENQAIVIDLKTTSKPVRGHMVKLYKTGMPSIDYYATGFPSSYLYYDYYRQQSYYAACVLAKFKVEKVVSFIIAVETSGLFECAVYGQSPDLFKAGCSEIKQLVNMYEKCVKDNDWSSLTEKEKKDKYLVL